MEIFMIVNNEQSPSQNIKFNIKFNIQKLIAPSYVHNNKTKCLGN